jgi:hypothetical protein
MEKDFDCSVEKNVNNGNLKGGYDFFLFVDWVVHACSSHGDKQNEHLGLPHFLNHVM